MSGLRRLPWLLALGGGSAGLAYAALSLQRDPPLPVRGLLVWGAAFFLGLCLLRAGVTRAVRRFSLVARDDGPYGRWEALTYGAFALAGPAAALGVRLCVPTAHLLLLAFAVLQGALVLADRRGAGREAESSADGLALLFFFSGFSALIYQVSWQRALFQVFGVSLQSVTIVVSIFMFGLGLGSLAGAFVSRRWATRAPLMFFLCEALIGLFGFCSLGVIRWVAGATLSMGPVQIAGTVFAILGVPTLLMGATLPILVEHLCRSGRRVGASVSTLYFLNTLGSAVASIYTVDLLFVFTGLRASVSVAASLNLLVAFLVYRHMTNARPASGPAPAPATDGSAPRLSFAFACVLSALSGFLSIGQEILWVRMIGFATAGLPQVFGHVLGFFLAGVAFGSVFWCSRPGATAPLARIGLLLAGGAVAFFLSPSLVAETMALSYKGGILLSYCCVAVVAFLQGGIFTLICEQAVEAGHGVGMRVGLLYIANLVGSTVGPLVTGFVLLDHFSLVGCIGLFTMASLGAGGALILSAGRPARGLLAGLGVAAALLLVVSAKSYPSVMRKLLFKKEHASEPEFSKVIESRHGLIHAVPTPWGEKIYGGGGFDVEYFSAAPFEAEHSLTSPAMVGALHPAPKRILQICMSIGQWTRVLSSYEDLERLDVVELNPSYLEMSARFPGLEELLRDPKVRIHFEDGRRWLMKNADQYDVIVMSIPHHWRSQISSLLSVENISSAKAHLRPGGVLFYTITGSPDVIRTAAQLFPNVALFGNLIAVSEAPFTLTPEERYRNMRKFGYLGKRFADSRDPRVEQGLRSLAASDLRNIHDEFANHPELVVITDDNMASEFKRPRSLLADLYAWRKDRVPRPDVP